MSDSPSVRAPIDPQEQPVLDELLRIRDKLLLLKSDKTQYVKSADVTSHYNAIIAQVEALNSIRSSKRDEQNRLDTVLEDCFQLISLFFMTIGRNNEAPAAYSLVSTIKRLLDHLKEAYFFARADLDGLARRLDLIEESVEKTRDAHSPHLLTLLESRIQLCRVRLDELRALLSMLSPELMQTHEKLVSILRSLSGINVRSKFDPDAVKDFQKQLKDIAENMGGDAIISRETEQYTPTEALDRYAQKLRKIAYSDAVKLPGEEVVRDLIERCYLWSEIVYERKGKIDDRFRDTYDSLVTIRNQLEKLSLTQAWSLRETDLYSYQRKLERIDESRNDRGEFLDAQGKPAELYESRTLLYLIRKSYATIFYMLTSSEPVSEALLPVYNQLMTLRKCLIEVKKSGGVSSPRELYPYSMKLNSIDSMRSDGKFVVNGDIPEGQAAVHSLLSECFDLSYELRSDAEKEESDEDQRSDDDEDSGVHMKEATLKDLRDGVRSLGVNDSTETTS